MSEQREKDLWKELDRLAFLASVATVTVLTIAYFAIAGSTPSSASILGVARTFALDVIANLIPTFLLLVGSYAVLRRIQIIKTQKQTEELSEELASRVAAKIFQTLAEMASQGATIPTPRPLSEQDKFSLMVSGEFEITNKHFDSTSRPQKIVVQFTNRGNSVIRIHKVKFSATKDLPDTALLTSYRKESGGRYVILPFESSDAEVLPGQDFLVEICLAQKWEQSTINGLMGSLGYLKPEVTYNGQSVELFYGI